METIHSNVHTITGKIKLGLSILVLFCLLPFQFTPPALAKQAANYGFPAGIQASEDEGPDTGEPGNPSQSGTYSPQAAYASVDVPILMYHHVNDQILDYLTVQTEEFNRQLDALEAYGFETITLNDFIDIRNGVITPPSKPVIITVDDGYRDLYTNIFPAMEERGMVFTSFLFLTYIDKDDWMVTWDFVREMYDSGQRFESHSATHADLVELYGQDPNLAKAEIVNSKAAIETQIPGHQVKFFAYPYGLYNSNIQQFISEAGYSAALSVNSGIENTATADLLALKRQQLTPDISVDYKAGDPQNFFMNLVDSDFPVPNVAVQETAVFDSQGKARNVFSPGETVTIIVTASNSASEVDVIASLELDDDNDPKTPSSYNSHTTQPKQDVEKTPFIPGPGVQFEYRWTIPASAKAGQYYSNFSVHDQYYILGFGQTGWQSLFQVVSTVCHPLTLGFTGTGEKPTASPANSTGCPTGQYSPGASIQLTAYPASGYQISGWSGTNNDSLVSTSNTLTMPNSPHSVQVNYVLTCYPLTLGFTGTGEKPTASPTNSAGCSSGQYVPGANIQLTAYPASGHHIGGWSGTNDDSLVSTSNTLTMPSRPHSVQVDYEAECYSLALGFLGSGQAPTASPASSAGCATGRFVTGETIQLTAHPVSGYHTAKWEGTAKDSLASNSNTVIMPSSSHAVIAYYDKDDAQPEPPTPHKVLIPLIVKPVP